jgi:hypothetical protein
LSGPEVAKGSVERVAEGRLPLASVERILATCLVLLKLARLHMAWGHMEGFDADPWMDVFHVTHWFQRLPDPKSLFGAYHPPLSFLVARVMFAVYPHEVEVSQLLSTLAILGATFALRDVLRTIGVLWTLPGMAMLYVTASLPLLVWMAIETSYDALVFMWFMVCLALSVRLFWAPGFRWKARGDVIRLALLALALAGGLSTKFNALLACPLPFAIILVRRGPRALLREGAGPLAAVTLAAAIVAPLYYSRYYVPLHAFFPSNMDWLKVKELEAARALRDAHPVAFWTHVLRLPTESIHEAVNPVRDSFFHAVWFHLWKRDELALGGHEDRAAFDASNLYAWLFAVLMLVSAALLSAPRRRLPAVWRHLGVVFLGVLLIYAAALLTYGWRYPLFDWTPLKAKYMTPGVLWVGFCAALPMVNRSTSAVSPRMRRLATRCVVVLLLGFMFANHLLPVY